MVVDRTHPDRTVAEIGFLTVRWEISVSFSSAITSSIAVFKRATFSCDNTSGKTKYPYLRGN
jgi:hypothetical protein